MQIEAASGHIHDSEMQAIAVAVFKDEKTDAGLLQELDGKCGGGIKSVLDSEELKGKEGETAFVHLGANEGNKAQRLLLVGVGDASEYTRASVSQMAGTALRTLRGKNVKSILIAPRFDGDAEDTAAAVAEGALIATFDCDKYRTVDKEERQIERLAVYIDGADAGALERGISRGQIIGESVNFTRDMANEPGAYLTPTMMADRAREVASDCGLSIDVLDEARMEQEGMGSLLSVSRGSDEPGKLIILKYTPADDAEHDGLLSFVGKGITFDSGGISLKPGENMELMKYD